MPSLNQNQPPTVFMDKARQNEVIQKLKEHIDSSGAASVFWAIKLFESPNPTEIEKISALITKDGKYLRTRDTVIDYNYFISLNPNYELNESIKKTNKLTRRTNRITACFAGVTALIVVLSYFKDASQKPLQINIRPPEQWRTLDTQKRNLPAIQHAQGSSNPKSASSNKVSNLLDSIK